MMIRTIPKEENTDKIETMTRLTFMATEDLYSTFNPPNCKSIIHMLCLINQNFDADVT